MIQRKTQLWIIWRNELFLLFTSIIGDIQSIRKLKEMQKGYLEWALQKKLCLRRKSDTRSRLGEINRRLEKKRKGNNKLKEMPKTVRNDKERLNPEQIEPPPSASQKVELMFAQQEELIHQQQLVQQRAAEQKQQRMLKQPEYKHDYNVGAPAAVGGVRLQQQLFQSPAQAQHQRFVPPSQPQRGQPHAFVQRSQPPPRIQRAQPSLLSRSQSGQPPPRAQRGQPPVPSSFGQQQPPPLGRQQPVPLRQQPVPLGRQQIPPLGGQPPLLDQIQRTAQQRPPLQFDHYEGPIHQMMAQSRSQPSPPPPKPQQRSQPSPQHLRRAQPSPQRSQPSLQRSQPSPQSQSQQHSPLQEKQVQEDDAEIHKFLEREKESIEVTQIPVEPKSYDAFTDPLNVSTDVLTTQTDINPQSDKQPTSPSASGLESVMFASDNNNSESEDSALKDETPNAHESSSNMQAGLKKEPQQQILSRSISILIHGFGEVFQLEEVDPDDRVSIIKDRIHELHTIPASKQMLEFSGRVLRDNVRIGEIPLLKNLSEIHLSIKMFGGSKHCRRCADLSLPGDARAECGSCLMARRLCNYQDMSQQLSQDSHSVPMYNRAPQSAQNPPHILSSPLQSQPRSQVYFDYPSHSLHETPFPDYATGPYMSPIQSSLLLRAQHPMAHVSHVNPNPSDMHLNQHHQLQPLARPQQSVVNAGIPDPPGPAGAASSAGGFGQPNPPAPTSAPPPPPSTGGGGIEILSGIDTPRSYHPKDHQYPQNQQPANQRGLPAQIPPMEDSVQPVYTNQHSEHTQMSFEGFDPAPYCYGFDHTLRPQAAQTPSGLFDQHSSHPHTSQQRSQNRGEYQRNTTTTPNERSYNQSSSSTGQFKSRDFQGSNISSFTPSPQRSRQGNQQEQQHQMGRGTQTDHFPPGGAIGSPHYSNTKRSKSRQGRSPSRRPTEGKHSIERSPAPSTRNNTTPTRGRSQNRGRSSFDSPPEQPGQRAGRQSSRSRQSTSTRRTKTRHSKSARRPSQPSFARSSPRVGNRTSSTTKKWNRSEETEFYKHRSREALSLADQFEITYGENTFSLDDTEERKGFVWREITAINGIPFDYCFTITQGEREIKVATFFGWPEVLDHFSAGTNVWKKTGKVKYEFPNHSIQIKRAELYMLLKRIGDKIPWLKIPDGVRVKLKDIVDAVDCIFYLYHSPKMEKFVDG